MEEVQELLKETSTNQECPDQDLEEDLEVQEAQDLVMVAGHLLDPRQGWDQDLQETDPEVMKDPG